VGLIVLGAFRERFRASLEHWRPRDYERHWHEAVARLVEGAAESCLITNLVRPDSVGDNVEWWPAWRVGDEARFHQEVFLPGLLGSPFDPRDPYVHVGGYEPDRLVSEWRIPLSDLERFRARAGA
jgi:hypothetical protein